MARCPDDEVTFIVDREIDGSTMSTCYNIIRDASIEGIYHAARWMVAAWLWLGGVFSLFLLSHFCHECEGEGVSRYLSLSPIAVSSDQNVSVDFFVYVGIVQEAVPKWRQRSRADHYHGISARVAYFTKHGAVI